MNEWGPFLTCTLTSGQILLSFSLWCLLSELLLFFVGNTKFRLLSEKMRLAFFFIHFYLISHSSCLVLYLYFTYTHIYFSYSLLTNYEFFSNLQIIMRVRFSPRSTTNYKLHLLLYCRCVHASSTSFLFWIFDTFPFPQKVTKKLSMGVVCLHCYLCVKKCLTLT